MGGVVLAGWCGMFDRAGGVSVNGLQMILLGAAACLQLCVCLVSAVFVCICVSWFGCVQAGSAVVGSWCKGSVGGL